MVTINKPKFTSSDGPTELTISKNGRYVNETSIAPVHTTVTFTCVSDKIHPSSVFEWSKSLGGTLSPKVIIGSSRGDLLSRELTLTLERSHHNQTLECTARNTASEHQLVKTVTLDVTRKFIWKWNFTNKCFYVFEDSFFKIFYVHVVKCIKVLIIPVRMLFSSILYIHHDLIISSCSHLRWSQW